MPNAVAPKWRNYRGPRVDCWACAREGVPVVSRQMVKHWMPNHDVLCSERGLAAVRSQADWLTQEDEAPPKFVPEEPTPPSMDDLVKMAAQTGGRVRSVGEMEADLARRPCPKCSKVVTYSAGVLWDHPCGEKR